MPIIRKIFEIGGSKAITLPRSWFDFHERQSGEKISEVAIEVDDTLTVIPVLPKRGNPS